MGNETPNASTYSVLKPINWQLEAKLLSTQLVIDPVTHQSGELYKIPIMSLQNQLPIYQFRHDNPTHIATIRNVQSAPQQYLCTGTKTINVVTERIPFRLSDLGNIGYAQGLYIMQCILKAAGIISVKYFNKLTPKQQPGQPQSYLQYTEQMICFTQKGEAKLWLNQNLPTNTVNFSQMQTNGLLDCFDIERKTVENLMWLVQNKMNGNKFKQYLESKNQEIDTLSNFQNCIEFILRMRAVQEGESEGVRFVVLPSMLGRQMENNIKTQQSSTPIANNSYLSTSWAGSAQGSAAISDRSATLEGSSVSDVTKFAMPPRPPRKMSRSGSKERLDGSKSKPIAKPNINASEKLKESTGPIPKQSTPLIISSYPQPQVQVQVQPQFQIQKQPHQYQPQQAQFFQHQKKLQQPNHFKQGMRLPNVQLHYPAIQNNNIAQPINFFPSPDSIRNQSPYKQINISMNRPVPLCIPTPLSVPVPTTLTKKDSEDSQKYISQPKSPKLVQYENKVKQKDFEIHQRTKLPIELTRHQIIKNTHQISTPSPIFMPLNNGIPQTIHIPTTYSQPIITFNQNKPIQINIQQQERSNSKEKNFQNTENREMIKKYQIQRKQSKNEVIENELGVNRGRGNFSVGELHANYSKKYSNNFQPQQVQQPQPPKQNLPPLTFSSTTPRKSISNLNPQILQKYGYYSTPQNNDHSTLTITQIQQFRQDMEQRVNNVVNRPLLADHRDGMNVNEENKRKE